MLLFLLFCLPLLLLVPACEGGRNEIRGSLIAGITSNLRVGTDIAELHVVMRAADVILKDQVLTASNGLKLPREFTFADLPDGTPVDLKIDAFHPGDATTPSITRLAATQIVAGKVLFLHVVLDSRCAVGPGSTAPLCLPAETCIAGQCASARIDPATLTPYVSTWTDTEADPCKPLHSTPTVIVGQGQTDYLPMNDGDVAQVEAGPQGGHHIWVAIRDKGLRQSGSITSVTGHVPDLNLDVGPFNVIFTFSPDEGGFCKLYGLRFQLDQDHEIAELLGHPLEVKVVVTDPDSDVGIGVRSVVLSNALQP